MIEQILSQIYGFYGICKIHLTFAEECSVGSSVFSEWKKPTPSANA
jgi:hypothetical protein